MVGIQVFPDIYAPHARGTSNYISVFGGSASRMQDGSQTLGHAAVELLSILSGMAETACSLPSHKASLDEKTFPDNFLPT